jgi:N4-gp56 family major capsid protein
MAMTTFAVGDALAVQRWSTSLAKEAEKKQYFRKFMGKGNDSLIMVKNELNKGKGEKITFALRMKLADDGIEGDNIIEGTSGEEALTFWNDSVFIDQRRKGTKSKGKMTEQRVPYNIRREGRDALSTWWAEAYDEDLFMYLSGARGMDASYKVGLGWTGRASNSFNTPSTSHHLWAGNATSLGTVDSQDKMTLKMVERCIAKAETADPMIQPFRVQGENKHILIMHTWQAYDLRTSISQNDWVDIQKAAGLRGKGNNLYQNSLGEYADVILHKHRNVVRFDSTTGAASGVTAARALFLGAQAAVVAWGGSSGMGRYSWNEELDDRGNALAITAGAIYGVTKCVYNSKDFGVFAIDAYCDDPNS